MTEKILIVDDEPNIVSSFASLLQDEGYVCIPANDSEEALRAMERSAIDLILLDLNLPGRSGIALLEELQKKQHSPRVLVVSGQSEISVALEAVRLGAVDYLEKPVAPDRLVASVRAAMMLVRVDRQRSVMADEVDRESPMIGRSRLMERLNRQIAQAAPSDATVLITGANGTGKELVATRLHLASPRRNKPLIKVNCPGIPETLFESELFGHIKGSFTGAVKDYPGKFALADEGTIFLDEIGDLPLPCQAKLLRVLETGEIETIGAVEKRVVDIRVLCATNRNLPELVQERLFREDLFYRISVLSVEVPLLRDRPDDIPLLVGEFLRKLAPDGQTALSAEAISFLTTLDWPGNVRQLRNLIERLAIVYPGRAIGLNELREQLGAGSSRNADSDEIGLNASMARFERSLIAETLAKCDGNIAEAARRLKIDRANLSRKIRDYAIKAEQ
ncbi:MAG TPA: sigma-54 dependent transcriptional regulator [candidate division Zixibacteria bacterium]|nr:sigma-54 dependent transcriptional regulator [candidate division Zixibacteria bacterium]